MKKDNGLTLQDLVNQAETNQMDFSKIYLLTSDGQPITEIDFSDEVPDLWFLGDEE